jgi:hypothetical protein
MPTSPPLGAAMLKGFVERELPDWHVRVLDLNLWMFEKLFSNLATGQFQLDPNVFPEGITAAVGLARAGDTFRGRNGDDFHTRPDLYNQYGELFLRFTEAYTRGLAQLCEAFDQGAPLSPIFEEFLEVIVAEKPAVVGIS